MSHINEYMTFKGLSCWFVKPPTGMGDATGNDDGLRIDNGSIGSQPQA